MNLNKFETYGIAFSIGAMALSLWFVRAEMTNNSLAELSTQDSSSPVFVADSDNQRAAVANAIMDATASGDFSRLIIDDVVIGNGTVAESGDTVTVNYIGTLQNGQQFDNSYLKGKPFTFTLGEHKVIEGWEEGIVGMRAGGQRILVIPAEKAYGKDGYGPIPGNASLVFAVELLTVEK